MRFFFLLTLIAFNTFAHENCKVESHLELLQEIKKLSQNLDFFAVSEQEISSAFCLKKEASTADEMNSWIEQQTAKYKMNETINGVSFEDESLENLNTFRYLTTSVDFLNRPAPAGQKIFSSTCKKVDCALKNIFGSEQGLQLMYMHRRYGMNGSHIARPDSAPWSKKDLDTVLLSLSDYPDGLFPAIDNKMLLRGKPGMGGFGVYANATMMVFEYWDILGPNSKRSIITHELGHFIAGRTYQDGDSSWLKKSAWEKKTKVENGKSIDFFESKKPEVFVSEYAKSNPAEDFAESVVAYRYNPQFLKKTSPDKYEIIKTTVFDGVEYVSETACKNPVRESQKAKKAIDQKVANWRPKEVELIRMTKRCNNLAIKTISKNGFVNNNEESFRRCYEESIQKQANEMLISQFKSHPMKSYLGPILRNVKVNLTANQINAISKKVVIQHKKELTKYFEASLNDRYACGPDFQINFYQSFEDMNPSSENYVLRDDYQKIAKKYCPKNNTKTPVSKIVKGIIK